MPYKLNLGRLLQNIKNMEQTTQDKVDELVRQEADMMLAEQFGNLNLDEVQKKNLRKMLEEKISGILTATSSIINPKKKLIP